MADDVRFSVCDDFSRNSPISPPRKDRESVHSEFRSNRIEFVQPVGILRENTKSDTTRGG